VPVRSLALSAEAMRRARRQRQSLTLAVGVRNCSITALGNFAWQVRIRALVSAGPFTRSLESLATVARSALPYPHLSEIAVAIRSSSGSARPVGS
jgi:hypothetical protein